MPVGLASLAPAIVPENPLRDNAVSEKGILESEDEREPDVATVEDIDGVDSVVSNALDTWSAEEPESAMTDKSVGSEAGVLEPPLAIVVVGVPLLELVAANVIKVDDPRLETVDSRRLGVGLETD